MPTTSELLLNPNTSVVTKRLFRAAGVATWSWSVLGLANAVLTQNETLSFQIASALFVGIIALLGVRLFRGCRVSGFIIAFVLSYSWFRLYPTFSWFDWICGVLIGPTVVAGSIATIIYHFALRQQRNRAER